MYTPEQMPNGPRVRTLAALQWCGGTEGPNALNSPASAATNPLNEEGFLNGMKTRILEEFHALLYAIGRYLWGLRTHSCINVVSI